MITRGEFEAHKNDPNAHHGQGAGSGLDADMVDGKHADEIALTYPGQAVFSYHTMNVGSYSDDTWRDLWNVKKVHFSFGTIFPNAVDYDILLIPVFALTVDPSTIDISIYYNVPGTGWKRTSVDSNTGYSFGRNYWTFGPWRHSTDLEGSNEYVFQFKASAGTVQTFNTGHFVIIPIY